MRKPLLMDNRKHEQMISDLGAYDYERVSSAKHGLFHKLLLQNWGGRFNELFLDYGCGPGFVSGSISSLGKQVVAFDISRKMVKIAKKKYNVPVLVADALHMPFKEESFSTICISGVLHHILDLDEALGEIHRCAEEVVCAEEPVAKREWSLAIRLANFVVYVFYMVYTRLIPVKRTSKTSVYARSMYERRLDPKQLIRLFEDRGFMVKEIRYYNHISLIHHFLSERTRERIFRSLISSKKGTNVEIIAFKR